MLLQKAEFLGKYILLERIASGGMAEVYLAKSQGLENVSKFFAIKRILPKFSRESSFIEMFKEEAKIAINLDHQNVVSIIEFGEENGQFFLVMEFVEGKNLREILGKLQKAGNRKLSIEHISYILNQCAAGLDFAHRCRDKSTDRPLNITHRDISPQNLMVNFEGSVKICDFGIAKAESKLDNTQAGTLKGKYGYMSPEQVDGLELDYRTDIFSMGIVLWELLANERLFYASNELNTLRKIQECDIKSLRKIDPSIPAELERITNKALAKDRSYRYQSAGELHRDLNRFLNQNYPDCSPQDVGSLISQLYLEEREDLRKRMVEYAQIHAIRPEANFDFEHTIVETITHTQPTGTNQSQTAGSYATSSHSTSSHATSSQVGSTQGATSSTQKSSLNLSLVAQTSVPNELEMQPIGIEELNDPEKEVTRGMAPISPHVNLYTDTIIGAKTPGPRTETNIGGPGLGHFKSTPKLQVQRPQLNKQAAYNGKEYSVSEPSPFFQYLSQVWVDKFLSCIAILSIGVAISGVALLYFKNHPDDISYVETLRPTIYSAMNTFGWQTPDQVVPVEMEQQSMSSTAPSPITLRTIMESDPAGADIYVDNIKTGLVTPAALDVKRGVPTRIMLVKFGVGMSNEVYVFQNDSTKVHKKIPAGDFGLVSVDVKLGNPNTEVYIDKELIKNPSGLVRYPVRQGMHHIIAKDELQHARAEQTIDVGPASAQEVVLILSGVARTPATH